MTTTKRIIRRQLRRLTRRLLWFLPEQIRYRLYRAVATVPESRSQSVVFKIAESKEELEQSFHLLYKAYKEVGLQKENPEQLRVTPYHALQSTTILIGVHQGCVVATLSLIADTAFGLPSDWAADLSGIRNRGRRIAEVSALAIDKKYRSQLLFPLLKFMYEYATKYYAADGLIAALTTPLRAHELYESILGFERVEEHPNQDYAFSNFIPVVVEYLDLTKAERLYAKRYAHKRRDKNLYHFFKFEEDPRFCFPKRRYFSIDDPVLTPSLLNYFFNRRSNCFKDMSIEQREKLFHLLPSESHRRMLPGFANIVSIDLKRRRSPRMNVKCFGQIDSEKVSQTDLEIYDVSEGGFRARILGRNFTPGGCTCRIRLAEFEVVQIQCDLVWQDGDIAGFKVEEDGRWQRAVRAMSPYSETTEMGIKSAA